MNPKIRLIAFIQKIFSKDKPVKKASQINPTVPLKQEIKNVSGNENLNCDHVFALLDKYVELDLEGLDAKQKMPDVHQHLKTCEECFREYQTLISVYKKLKY